MNTPLKVLGITLMLSASTHTLAESGSKLLEHLERERSQLVSQMLNPDLATAERSARIARATKRLVNLERLTLRDELLPGSRTPFVARAFENYDLTFLVHASAENKRYVTDHWLETLELTSSSVQSARSARR